MGWPSATAPPQTLTRAGSSPSIRLFAIETTANASLISHRSTSSFFQPILPSRRSIAPAGAVVNHSGACACPAAPTMRASGFQPRAAATSAAASTSAAAPSLIDEALPAVIVPSF